MVVADLAESIARVCRLPPGEVEWMQAMAERRTLRRGEAFCSIGQTRHERAFLHEGILQVYAVSTQGEHVVLDFMFPGSLAMALRGALLGIPSEVCIEAVTPCVLSVWPYEVGAAASARHVEWERLVAWVVTQAFLRKQQRDLALRVHSARERYAAMAAELPGAGQDIPQHLLASYLAITPQYLSRLKREARNQRRPARRRVSCG
jgi:CRP-like cAMP-binding protein